MEPSVQRVECDCFEGNTEEIWENQGGYLINWKEMEIPKDKTAQQRANAESQSTLTELLMGEGCERDMKPSGWSKVI